VNRTAIASTSDDPSPWLTRRKRDSSVNGNGADLRWSVLWMKRRWIGLLLGLLPLFCELVPGATLKVDFVNRFGGENIRMGLDTYTNAAGNRLTVTRLDYLLSDWELEFADGSRWSSTNIFAYVSGSLERNSVILRELPTNAVVRLGFHVGLNPGVNHSNPGLIDPDSPLNPLINHLHWNWQGGYVFLALEGMWFQSNGTLSGYSYHLANDANFIAVSLPVGITLSNPVQLTVGLDVQQLFSATQEVKLSDGANSTHSRGDDPVALKLAGNLRSAFKVIGARISDGETRAEGGQPVVELATNAAFYRFKFPSYVPKPRLPLDNPLTVWGVELGRRLFEDPRLSRNSQQSCSSCHQRGAGFTDLGRRFSVGIDGKSGHRNSMPLANLAWQSGYFWDGRAKSLREQVLEPIQSPIEMHQDLRELGQKLHEGKDSEAFKMAFGSPEITPQRIAKALEQYLLSLTSFHSKFDAVMEGGARFSADEMRGFELFMTEYDPRRQQFGADCFHCHGAPLFTDNSFHNNGLDVPETSTDSGLSAVSGRSPDVLKFKTPTLRNIAVTGPYMHDGRFATLAEVMEHYSTGVRRSQTLDPNLAKHPDGGVPLSAADKRSLIAFLKTLTDDRFLQDPPGDLNSGRP